MISTSDDQWSSRSARYPNAQSRITVAPCANASRASPVFMRITDRGTASRATPRLISSSARRFSGLSSSLALPSSDSTLPPAEYASSRKCSASSGSRAPA